MEVTQLTPQVRVYRMLGRMDWPTVSFNVKTVLFRMAAGALEPQPCGGETYRRRSSAEKLACTAFFPNPALQYLPVSTTG
jgi:hypothetical protein